MVFHFFKCASNRRLLYCLSIFKYNKIKTQDISIVDVLYKLTEEEIMYRDERASKIQVSVAGFPFEKELYEIINKQKDLEIYLQIEESDFNEESLKLKQITFPETNKLSGEIKIKEAPNKFVQLLELIGTLNEEQSYIYDADDINIAINSF